MSTGKGLTISIKLYGRDGRKVQHDEIELPAFVSDEEAHAICNATLEELRAYGKSP